MKSVWEQTGEHRDFAPLKGDISTDVLIIGGGMAGILCAYLLHGAGVPYVLTEAETVCGGITKNTTAKITIQHGLIYDKLLRRFGIDRARQYLCAQKAALQKYRELWRMFYRTVEVEERHNPKCRMGHMPKRYWRYMTEFSTAEQLAAPPPMLPAEREALLRAGRAALTAPASHVEPAADFSHNRLPGENKQDGERNQADAKANQCGENHMQASR